MGGKNTDQQLYNSYMNAHTTENYGYTKSKLLNKVKDMLPVIKPEYRNAFDLIIA
jgi:hypothetical protein